MGIGGLADAETLQVQVLLAASFARAKTKILGDEIMDYTDEEWLAFTYTLKELCKVVNRTVESVYINTATHEVKITYTDRVKFVEMANMDFRCIAIETLKYINGA